ncbi:MAG: hypothetical protein RLZZ612_502 [Pseudomonadota bacterium]
MFSHSLLSSCPAEIAHQEAVTGCVLGTALGDAWGLPFEGLSRRRTQRWMGLGPLRHRLWFGMGLCSDDTEHTCLLAQALLAARLRSRPNTTPEGMVKLFRTDLTARLRWWLLGLPAGIGWATLRALWRHWALCLFPHVEGVASAGNGPAMRSALLGVCAGHDLSLLRDLVRASTRITHTDLRAEHGALAVALAAHLGAQALRQGRSLETSTVGQNLLTLFDNAIASDDGKTKQLPSYFAMRDALGLAAASAQRGESTELFAASLGCERGVSGFVMHTVPVALHAWMCHPQALHLALHAVIRCGGDTDTSAAITGAVVGAAVGDAGIPAEGLQGLREWPRDVAWLRELGRRVALSWPGADRESVAETTAPLPLSLTGLMMRNCLFFWLVLLLGLRRLLPPY